jgi:hypothetical protein
MAGGAGLLMQSALFGSLGAAPAVAADAYFSPAGSDSAGYAIGVDCTYAAPCKTVTKALSFLAGNIASGAGPNRNYSLAFDGGSGPFYLSGTAILTSAHTVSSGYTTTFDVYNGTQAAWSGGLDTAGTWTSTTLPSGASGCVSSYLAHLAPLTELNAKSYVGVAWINGHRVQETINPRSGNPWATVPGYAGNPDRGSQLFVGAEAYFTSGNASIQTNHLEMIGTVGEPIGFNTAAGGLAAHRPYWILTKSGASGGGRITISASPGGAPLTPSIKATVQLEDPVQSGNAGDRSIAPGENVFPYNASVADFATAYNQTDVKGEIAAAEPSLAPVAMVNGKGVVALNSRMFSIQQMIPGNGYRVWNRFEDLGSGGYTGELYTNRTTGLIYYTPRTDLTESCASINATGQAIIPSTLETLVKISSAKADIATSGAGAAGATVGNFVFKHILFEHTNTSVFTGDHVLSGAVGGFVDSVSSHYAGPLNWAVVTIGAKNVTFDTVTMAHFGGSALAIGWGSNHDTVQNSQLYDAGGALITAGAALSYFDSYHYNSDSGYYGTSDFAPSTPSFNTGYFAVNADLTGASDCCQTITNNFLYDGGIVEPAMGCMTLSGWQKFSITHNTMHDCGGFGFTASADVAVSDGSPSFNGIVQGVHSGSTIYYPFYANVFSYNEIFNCGYETTVLGARVPGGAMMNDFGCFYISGPQDGDGTNPANALQITYNKVHDTSAAAYPVNNEANGVMKPHGVDAILDYHDGNNSNGVVEKYNLFYNRSAAAVGATVYPTRITQHTGNLRTVITNNIFASVFPAGFQIYTDYVPRMDITPNYLVPEPISNHTYTAGDCANPCYVMHNYKIYSSTFSGSLTTGNNTPPTCSGGTCADGGVTWTFVENLPGTPYLQDYSNITAWKVTSDPTGATNDFVFADAYPTYPQYEQFGGNLYSMTGNYLHTASGSFTFVQWLAETGAQGVLQDSGSLYGASAAPDAPGITPNFVSLDTGNFLFNSTYSGPGTASACGGTGAGTVSPACGLGFVPWDYSNVGAH